jgi:hypothetical protein
VLFHRDDLEHRADPGAGRSLATGPPDHRVPDRDFPAQEVDQLAGLADGPRQGRGRGSF